MERSKNGGSPWRQNVAQPSTGLPTATGSPEGLRYVRFHNSVIASWTQVAQAFRASEKIDVAQAFRPAVSGGPDGPHYIRSDFFTGPLGLPGDVQGQP